MNLENNPTVEELRDLLRKCDDRAGRHVLWVAKNGDVHVSLVSKVNTPTGIDDAEPDMQLRSETFEAGNEYVGPDAAADDDWVHELYDALVNRWPMAKGKPMIDCVGQI